MKKKILIINIVLIIIMIFSSTNTYASTLGEMIDNAEDFLSKGNSVESTIDTAQLNKTSNTIYNILLTIAIVLAIIIGMVIGIQFLIGSAEEQAKIKETLVPYVVGVFIVFSAFAIWKIAVNVGNDVTGEDTGEQIITEDDAKSNYSEVLSVSQAEIENMTKQELEEYLDKIFVAIAQANAFEDDEQNKALQKKKEAVLDELNSRPTDLPTYTGPVEESFKEREEKLKEQLEGLNQ